MCPIHPMVDQLYDDLVVGYVPYLTILWSGISSFNMDMVNPVHWVHPLLLHLADSLNRVWVFITKLHIPPCELFNCLIFFLQL